MLKAIVVAASALAMADVAMAAPPATPGQVSVFEEGGGYVLRSTESMPLYTFDRDAPGQSNCNDRCAAAWPPLSAGADAKPVGDWAPIKRADGSLQWAWQNKPVYTFVKDSAEKPTGDGMGGVWRLLPSIPR